MSIVAPVPTSVYRYYDKAGVLLYVGITSRRTVRQSEHNADKEWWPYVARQEVEHFPNRDAAAAQERALIRKFRPPFNVQHNPGHAEIRVLYMAAGLGGNRELRGGSQAKLTSRAARQAFAAHKGGRVPLALINSDADHLTYATQSDSTQMLSETSFSIDPPVLLVAPAKVATYTHRFTQGGQTCLVFGRRGDAVAPPRIHLVVKARQPFSLWAHRAVAI